MAQTLWQKIKSRNGSLLAEALLAVVILSISLTFIIQSMIAGLRASRYVADCSSALILLENKMSGLMMNRYSSAYWNEKELCTDDIKEYQLLTKSRPSADRYQRNLNDVQIEVIWRTGKKEYQIALTTYLLKEGKRNE